MAPSIANPLFTIFAVKHTPNSHPLYFATTFPTPDLYTTLVPSPWALTSSPPSLLSHSITQPSILIIDSHQDQHHCAPHCTLIQIDYKWTLKFKLLWLPFPTSQVNFKWLQVDFKIPHHNMMIPTTTYFLAINNDNENFSLAWHVL